MRGSTTVFTMKNILESLAYYRDKIGFDVAFECGTPTFYAGLCSGEVTLHLISAAQARRQGAQGTQGLRPRPARRRRPRRQHDLLRHGIEEGAMRCCRLSEL